MRVRTSRATGGSERNSAADRRTPAPLRRGRREEEEREAVSQDSTEEALGVVRDLNKNVFQIASSLTKEWDELGSSRSNEFTISEEDIDTFSQSYGPALVHRVLDRKPVAVAFLIQSCLCKLAAQISSSWRSNGELRGLRRSVCQHSPDSGRYKPSVASEMQLMRTSG